MKINVEEIVFHHFLQIRCDEDEVDTAESKLSEAQEYIYHGPIKSQRVLV